MTKRRNRVTWMQSKSINRTKLTKNMFQLCSISCKTNTIRSRLKQEFRIVLLKVMMIKKVMKCTRSLILGPRTHLKMRSFSLLRNEDRESWQGLRVLLRRTQCQCLSLKLGTTTLWRVSLGIELLKVETKVLLFLMGIKTMSCILLS